MTDSAGSSGGTLGEAVVELGVADLLGSLLDELGLDGCYVARLSDEGRTVRCAVGDGPGHDAAAYDRLLVEGKVPSVVGDASGAPQLADAGATGAFVGVVLRLADESLYGSLCAFSSSPKPDFGDSEIRLLWFVGSLLTPLLEAEVVAERQAAKVRTAVDDVIDQGLLDVVFQPIVDAATRVPVGFEALARIPVEPYRPPDEWMADAVAAGRGLELELLAVTQAVHHARKLPEGCYLTVNADAFVTLSGELVDVLEGADRAVVVEVGGHEKCDLDELREALVDLQDAGHDVALDDGGDGHAGLTRVLELRPDIVKLARSVVSGVDTDPVKQAMATSAVRFTRSTGATLVAEGVETEAEANTLYDLGVRVFQGYLFGRPAPASEWTAAEPIAGLED